MQNIFKEGKITYKWKINPVAIKKIKKTLPLLVLNPDKSKSMTQIKGITFYFRASELSSLNYWPSKCWKCQPEYRTTWKDDDEDEMENAITSASWLVIQRDKRGDFWHTKLQLREGQPSRSAVQARTLHRSLCCSTDIWKELLNGNLCRLVLKTLNDSNVQRMNNITCNWKSDAWALLSLLKVCSERWRFMWYKQEVIRCFTVLHFKSLIMAYRKDLTAPLSKIFWKVSFSGCNAVSEEEEGEKKTCVGSDLARLCVWFLCNTWLSIQSHQWSLLDRLLTTFLHISLCRLQRDVNCVSACHTMSATLFCGANNEGGNGRLVFQHLQYCFEHHDRQRVWDHLQQCCMHTA